MKISKYIGIDEFSRCRFDFAFDGWGLGCVELQQFLIHCVAPRCKHITIEPTSAYTLTRVARIYVVS